jgi:hypothetical protein
MLAPGRVADVCGATEVTQRHKALNSFGILARYSLQHRHVAEIFLSVVVFINGESLTRQSHNRFGQRRRILRSRFREGILLCTGAGNQTRTNSTGNSHGFQLYKGQFTTIDCAGSTGSPGFQFLSGLDPIGRIVGGYGTSDGLTHGSLIIEGNCIAIDIPPGTNTCANAIDAEGDIVGRYTGSDGAIHGFLFRKFVNGTTMP